MFFSSLLLPILGVTRMFLILSLFLSFCRFFVISVNSFGLFLLYVKGDLLLLPFRVRIFHFGGA